jgi:hypothetical protein
MIYARAIGALGVILLAGFGLWRLYHGGYEAGRAEVQARWDAETIRRDEAQRDALLAYADKVKHAQEQHDHDQDTIDTLADDARRLRIHLPACAGDAAGPRAGEDGAAGLLPAAVDQRFAEFQARVGGLIRRCDQRNIDAIRANAPGERSPAVN